MNEQIRHGRWKDTLEGILDSQAYTSVYYLVDRKVYELHELSLPLEKLFLLEANESNKSVDTASRAWQFLSQSGADRGCLLVSIGGGLTTDLGGFIASTYMRGMDAIYIPTTVLGMVDAAVGGKTGVNYSNFKNRVGTFQKAQFVIVDTELLQTLPDEQWLSGWAELVKHTLIADAELWDKVSSIKTVEQIRKELSDLVARAVTIKQDIVERDFMEEGERKKLNFGHTIGHALESLLIEKGRAVPHGFAVAAGMMIESDLAYRIGSLSKSDFNGIRSYLSDIFPRLQLELKEIPRLHYFLEGDKKNKGAHINFTLLEGIGQALIDQRPEKKTIDLSLESYIDEYKKL